MGSLVWRMFAWYNAVLLPILIASIILTYEGFKLKVPAAAVAGIVLSFSSPFLAYVLFRAFLYDKLFKNRQLKKQEQL